ncbi:hypothetical protein P280DRAFT_323291 [Massarina eburnea CBS 473.64]|uniref:Uncharacterized protein n=1 Tax=Massarina eburnea CBS 473.64 TaxID=1395130 RepID=A0A6A6S0S0_9PLEO|nr:hypothetical protein P280DRAFT_323291 [Massarina eburnea CBS 473.64]
MTPFDLFLHLFFTPLPRHFFCFFAILSSLPFSFNNLPHHRRHRPLNLDHHQHQHHHPTHPSYSQPAHKNLRTNCHHWFIFLCIKAGGMITLCFSEAEAGDENARFDRKSRPASSLTRPFFFVQVTSPRTSDSVLSSLVRLGR